MESKLGKFTIKPESVPAGLCRLMEDGRPCQKPSETRGLCRDHYSHLLYRKQLEGLALPSSFDTAARVREMRIKETPEPGLCRLIEQGKACDKPVATRGLCHSHHHWLMVQDLLDDWALPPLGRRKKTYQINPQADAGRCALLEDGNKCLGSPHIRGICKRHYSRLQSSRQLEALGTISAHPEIALRLSAPIKQVEVKKEPQDGLCRVTDNGLPCLHPVNQRGLCANHSAWARQNGLIDKLGLAKQKIKLRVYELKPMKVAGICPVMTDGIWCQNPAQRRGLCVHHYQNIWTRNDLDLEDFAQEDELEKFRRGEVGPGGCHLWILKEGEPDQVCAQKHWARGFCKTHYNKMKRNPDLLKLADPIAAAPKIAVTIGYWRKNGLCRAIVNGKACSGKADSLGLCTTHYNFMRKHDRVAEAKKEPKPDKEPRYRRKDAAESLPGVCLLVRNDMPCRRPARLLSLCLACHGQLERRGRVQDFALADMREVANLDGIQVQERPIPSLCRLEKNGEPCRAQSSSRGLCKMHYKLCLRRDRMADFALADGAYEASPYRVYLDKNIVLRYAEHCYGKSGYDRAAVHLVESVLAQQLVAYVSADTVRLTAYKTAKRLLEQGRSEAEARTESRRFAGELFYGPRGYWVIIPDTNASLRSCTIGGKLPDLDLEDALEVWEYTLARNFYSIQGFVTHDRELLSKHVEALSAAQLLDKLGVAKPKNTGQIGV